MRAFFRRSKGEDPRTSFSVFAEALNLFEQAMEPELLMQSGLQLIVRFLQARYGLIFDNPDQAGGLALAAAFDAERQRDPSGPPLQIKAIPEIASSVVRGRAKILRKEQELLAATEALNLGPTGEAMLAPMMLQGERSGGIMMLARTETPNWAPANLEALVAWSDFLGRKINSWPELTEAAPDETEMLKGELRLALRELAEVSEVESGATLAQVGTLTSQLMAMHEPITSIRGYNEMLRSGAIGKLEPDQRKFLDHIRVNAAKLEQQLTGLLDLVRAPQNAVHTLIEIEAVLDIAEAQVATGLSESGIEVERSIPDSLPQVSVDSDLLRQIVVILLERAIRISPSSSHIVVAAEAEEDGWVSLSVADQGPGIPAEDLGRVFQAGVEAEGADLGLPQVKSLADSLGGRVWIGSEMGSGSIVTVLVPASEGAGASAS